jgi:hypothetical protein
MSPEREKKGERKVDLRGDFLKNLILHMADLPWGKMRGKQSVRAQVARNISSGP